MKLFDSLIEKDGKVSSILTHLLIWVGGAAAVAFFIKILAALMFPILVVGGIWAGYQSWQADKRINGSINASD